MQAALKIGVARRNQFLLTLWDDFGEIEGAELAAQIGKGKEFPVILARNIGISGYQGQRQTKTCFLGNVSGNFAGSSTALTVNPVHRRVVSIAEITTAASVGCKQKKCTEEKKQFDCAKCQRQTTLVPRCTFQIDLIDGNGSTSVFISGDPAEKLLSMKAEDIFDTTGVKNQLLRVDQTQQMLSKRLFHIQLRKSSSWTNSNVT
ncbi:hypothetical protein KY284_001000 [Solanum tuberosum]|nr:hypothetical protein KY284_001000 [Solanum tuberosum]